MNETQEDRLYEGQDKLTFEEIQTLVSKYLEVEKEEFVRLLKAHDLSYDKENEKWFIKRVEEYLFLIRRKKKNGETFTYNLGISLTQELDKEASTKEKIVMKARRRLVFLWVKPPKYNVQSLPGNNSNGHALQPGATGSPKSKFLD